jgi:peptidylprolyl isomerase
MKRRMVLMCLTLLAAPATAQLPAPSDPAPGDWKLIPDDEILVMTLAGDRAGDRTVVIRLAARFAPAHVANIRTLARSHWWDATSIYRVQENFVAQWGDPTEKKPLPAGVTERPAAEFEIGAFEAAQTLSKHDAYSTASGLTADGWPVAANGAAAWLTHCYGAVSVARDALPDTGSGAALFTPIGQSPRRLDRNYTVVGRIIEGMKFLSTLPRSDAPLGVYADARERTAIVSVRLASELPAAERPHFAYRGTDNVRFAALIALRENPPGMVSAGGVDVCDMPMATMRVRTAP